MAENTKLENILFLDIETVPEVPTYKKLPVAIKKLWDKKAERLASKEDDSPETLYKKAGIYAEFGKIICISVGIVTNKNSQWAIKVKSFFGDDEKQLLTDFFAMVKKHFAKKDRCFCAHNGKEFDYPYISRRALINGLPLPEAFSLSGKKPWEVNHLDTMEMWKFGDYKSYTSLELLAHVFKIPTPKNEMDGSEVAKVYWSDKDMQKIVNYCQKDVVTVARLYLKFHGLGEIEDDQIQIVT